VLFVRNFWHAQIKEEEEEKDHFEDTGVDGRIMLKCMYWDGTV
jgi:hypothetical protein